MLLNYYPHAVPSRKALLQPFIKYRRATYSTCGSSEDNSYVILDDYPSPGWRAAQITDIIVQATREKQSEATYDVLIADRLFTRLNNQDACRDFYSAQKRNFGVGCLFYGRPEVTKTFVRVQDMNCHFAKNPLPKIPGITKDCIHVQPLYRVSTKLSNSYANLSGGKALTDCI